VVEEREEHLLADEGGVLGGGCGEGACGADAWKAGGGGGVAGCLEVGEEGGVVGGGVPGAGDEDDCWFGGCGHVWIGMDRTRDWKWKRTLREGDKMTCGV
jgi:hypothetical protein